MRRPELPELTGIRFYAALFVFLSHVPVIPGMGALAGERLVFNAGVVGVSFFFVLSGFILTYNSAAIFQAGVTSADYKRFVWDRLTKIWPVHLATILLVLPIAILSPNLPLDWRAVPIHALMLQCFWPPLTTPAFHDYLNVPSWSISCEWFFYLVAPMAMFLVLGNAARRLIAVLAVAVYAAGLGWFLLHGQSDVTRLYMVSWWAPSRFAEFLVGIFLGRLFLATRIDNATVSGLAQAAGVVLIVAGGMYRQYAPWPLWGGLLYVPGSTLLILGLASGRGFFAAHLRGPWLHRLGTASFSLYMVQAPILRAVKGVYLHFGWEVQSWIAFASVTAGMFVLVQAIAFLMCFGYEIPLQKRLRSLLPAAPRRGADSPLRQGLAKV